MFETNICEWGARKIAGAPPQDCVNAMRYSIRMEFNGRNLLFFLHKTTLHGGKQARILVLKARKLRTHGCVKTVGVYACEGKKRNL